MQKVKIINPFTGEVTEEFTNIEELVYGVDSAGNFLGLVPKGTEYVVVPGAPSNDRFKWDFVTNSWKYTETLAEIKQQALTDIDAVAGNTRLRYITDVPGQQAVYLIKLEQAKAYLQDVNATVPYIVAEAEVLNVSLAIAAQQIVDRANIWNNVVGPQIEGIRRKNKLAIEAATNAEQVYSIRALNLTELSVFEG